MNTFIKKIAQLPILDAVDDRVVIAVAIFAISFLVLKIFQTVCIMKLTSLASKTKNFFDDALIEAIRQLRPLFYASVSLYVTVLYVSPEGQWFAWAKIVLLLVVVYEGMRGFSHFLAQVSNMYVDSLKDTPGNKAHAQSMFRILKGVIMLVLWISLLLLILANLGVNVTSLVASLGIGGIAVALALQNVLSDLFSSFSIFIDKPFKVGDYITVGPHSGTVKHIGLKSTRLKLLRGEELVVSNRELTSAQVQNFKLLQNRRDAFTFSVPYETSDTLLKSIPSIVEKIISGVKDADFSRCHLHTLLADGLEFEVVYNVNSANYDTYMDVRQEVLSEILKKFNKKAIDMAYPTHVVRIEK